MLFKSLGAPLGRFGSPFFTQLDFEGGPKIVSLDLEAKEIRKNGFLDRVLKKEKEEFPMDSDAKMRCLNW